MSSGLANSIFPSTDSSMSMSLTFQTADKFTHEMLSTGLINIKQYAMLKSVNIGSSTVNYPLDNINDQLDDTASTYKDHSDGLVALLKKYDKLNETTKAIIFLNVIYMFYTFAVCSLLGFMKFSGSSSFY